MRRTIYLTALALFPFLPGCGDKLNPPVEDLPASDFQYVVKEQRQLKGFTWEDQGGGVLSNGEEAICQLYVTAYNEVILQTTASVNVSSSKPEFVVVEKVSPKEYHLVYKADGASTIRIWNGTEGKDAIVKSFSVIGLEYVDVTGLRFTYGGEPLVVKHVSFTRPPMCLEGDPVENEDIKRPSGGDFTWSQFKKPAIWRDDPDRPGYGTYVVDVTQGAALRFDGFEPENTSFRTVIDFESEWDYFRFMTNWNVGVGYHGPDEYNNWPNVKGANVDLSYFSGRSIWIAGMAPVYIACIKVSVSEKTGSKTKYLILYYGDEGDQ